MRVKLSISLHTVLSISVHTLQRAQGPGACVCARLCCASVAASLQAAACWLWEGGLRPVVPNRWLTHLLASKACRSTLSPVSMLCLPYMVSCQACTCYLHALHALLTWQLVSVTRSQSVQSALCLGEQRMFCSMPRCMVHAAGRAHGACSVARGRCVLSCVTSNSVWRSAGESTASNAHLQEGCPSAACRHQNAV
jgi:hypothetical protein